MCNLKLQSEVSEVKAAAIRYHPADSRPKPFSGMPWIQTMPLQLPSSPMQATQVLMRICPPNN